MKRTIGIGIATALAAISIAALGSGVAQAGEFNENICVIPGNQSEIPAYKIVDGVKYQLKRVPGPVQVGECPETAWMPVS